MANPQTGDEEDDDEEAVSTPRGDDDEWEKVPSPAAKTATATADDDEWEKVETPKATPLATPVTTKELPGATPKMLSAVNAGQVPYKPPTKGEIEAEGPAYAGFTPMNMLKHGIKGVGNVLKFGGSVAKDISDPNRPLFFGGGETGPTESVLHKYAIAPSEEQNRLAQGNVTPLESIGHSVAAAIPLLGPYIYGRTEEAARSGDVGGAVAETGGEILAGKLGEAGIGKLADAGTAAVKVGAPAVGEIAGRTLTGESPFTATKDVVGEIARGDPNVAAQRALGITGKSRQAQTAQRNIAGARPYLEGAEDLHTLQEKTKLGQKEVWKPYSDALDQIGDREVQGPDGLTTVNELEKKRLTLSAERQKLRKMLPTDRATALQKDADLRANEVHARAIEGAIDHEMNSVGVDSKKLRTVFGNLKGVEKLLEGRNTLTENNRAYGLGRLMEDFHITKPLRSLSKGLLPAIQDLAAGRPTISGKPTDVNVAEGFRPGTAGPKPDFQFQNPPRSAALPGVQFPGGQGAIPPELATAPVQGAAGPPGPFQVEQPPGGGLWQQQVGQPPELETGAPRSPFKEPIGPQPGPPEAPTEPITGQQQRLPMPGGPEEAPLFNEPINAPRNVPELQRLPGAAGPPQGLEAEPGQVPAKVGGEIEGKGEIQTTPAEKLRVGDTFVDDKGDPRRVTEIEGETVRTADHTMRDYEEGEIRHQGELNSPQAQLARGGVFHPGPEEAGPLPPREGTEIEGERPEIETPKSKIPANDEERGWVPERPTEQGPRTEPVQTAEKAIEAIKERVKDQTHEGAERDYKVYPKGELDPNKIYATTFLLDDGSALLGDKGIQSHMQLAREIGQHHLNDANAIRMVSPDSYELHGMPSEAQLAEMNRWQKGLQYENRQNVHNAGYMYWDFYPKDVTGYSADAVSEQHETGAGSPSDFRRAIEDYYGKGEAGGEGFKPDDVRISTRTPTALRATENPHTTPLTIDMDSVRNAQGLTEKLADVVKQYPDLAKAMKGAKTPAERLSRFVDHIADNLEWLHNQMPPEIREITRKWYDSANKMATDLAKEHDVDPKQTAGVMAALSPQKDWNMNVSLAKRVIETIKNQGGTVTSPEMLAKGKELTAEGANPAMKSVIKNLKGKTLDQVTDPYDKAAWIRLYDEAHNPRAYEEIAPDGRIIGNAKTMKGVDAKVAWGDLGSIEKAVNIMLDGSRENISNQLGSMHKVRNFYNNIIDPNSAHPDVTIDTHAVAAGHIQPFSGNSHEVGMNFGGPSSALTGSNGTYPLYAEAYRKAAAKLGLKPRELQSIVWEQVRDLFPAEWKTAANAKKVAGVWGEYGKGKLTLDAARKQIVDLAGGFKKPEWFEKQ